MVSEMLTMRQFEASKSLARSMWREARLAAAGAPENVIKLECRLQGERRSKALRAGCDEEIIRAAIFLQILKNGVVFEKENLAMRDLMHRAAKELFRRHGIDAWFVVDAVFRR